jgi:hypothetical protein
VVLARALVVKAAPVLWDVRRFFASCPCRVLSKAEGSAAGSPGIEGQAGPDRDRSPLPPHRFGDFRFAYFKGVLGEFLRLQRTLLPIFSESPLLSLWVSKV